MRVKLIISIFTLLLLAHFSLFSQNERSNPKDKTNIEKTDNLKHALGVALTSTVGRGFSYRFKPNKFGIQFTTIPIFKHKGEYNINTGLKFMYEFFESEKFNIYSYLGSEGVFERFYAFTGPPTPTPTSYFGRRTTISSSMGAGFNFHLGTYFDLSVNVGYGVYKWYSSDNFENIFSNIDGGIGLYFKF